MQAVFKRKIAQTIPHASELIEGDRITPQVVYGDREVSAIANDICESVSSRVHAIIARHRPDVLHVFTHGGPDAPAESTAGLFHNRGDYLSALRKTSSIDHYGEVSLPIDTKPGVVAFETESTLTQTFIQSFPYIKTIILAGYDFSAPVMANYKLGNGTYGANTRVFISFGFRLKRSMDQQLIVQNPIYIGPVCILFSAACSPFSFFPIYIGPVCILFSVACSPFSFFLLQVRGEPGSRERKPHKAHRAHQPLPAELIEKSSKHLRY